jgi:methylmalonyl-CoA mutase cobalamin-binding subunit
VTRLLLAALPGADPSTAGHEAGPTPTEQALTWLARALRDAGHEVVHAGQDADERLVVAAAVQEDVEVVVLVTPASYDAGPLAAELAGAPEDGDDAVVLVAVGPDERTADMVGRVADEMPTG